MIGLAELTRRVMPLTGRLAFAGRRAAQTAKPVQCGPGCGACCRQLVTISPAEACHLNDLLTTASPARRAAALDRCGEIHSTLEQHDLLGELSRLDRPSLDGQAHYELARRYFALGAPCPFLEDESCSIHPMRFALCREYAVASDPSHCRDPFAGEISMITPAALVSQALLSTSAQLLGGEVHPIPIALAPGWTEANRQSLERRWDAAHALDLFVMYLEMSADLSGKRG